MRELKIKANVATIEPAPGANPEFRLDGKWRIVGGAFDVVPFHDDSLGDWHATKRRVSKTTLGYGETRDLAEEKLYNLAIKYGWRRLGCNLYLVDGSVPEPDEPLEEIITALRLWRTLLKSELGFYKHWADLLATDMDAVKEGVRETGNVIANIVLDQCLNDQ